MNNDDLRIILNEINKVNENVNKLDTKVDILNKDFYETKQIINKQEIHLEHHIMRTELNEKAVHLIEKRLMPVENWMSTFGNIFKIFGFVAASIACGSGVFGALKALQFYVFK